MRRWDAKKKATLKHYFRKDMFQHDKVSLPCFESKHEISIYFFSLTDSIGGAFCTELGRLNLFSLVRLNFFWRTAVIADSLIGTSFSFL